MFKGILKNLFDGFKESHQNISEEDFDKIWGEVEKRIADEPPPKVAFIGEAGVGKSSTLNALFNAGRPISHTEACTQEAEAVEIKAHGDQGLLIAYDMPGLGESIAKRGKHLATYEQILKEADVALWILDAQYRAFESIQANLKNEIRSINPKLVDRMVFALNKVDLVYPGETAWHELANLPSEEQENNIDGRIKDVQKKIREAVPTWKGNIIGYSAAKRYNLPQLFSEMLDAVPHKRQWVVASRKAIADFVELVDPRFLPPELVREKQKANSNPKDKVAEALNTLTPEQLKALNNKDELEKWLRNNFTG